MMKFGKIVYMWMKWWTLDRLFVWTYLNSLNKLDRFLNRLNRFLNIFYVWTIWTYFFYKVSVKFEHILLLFFKQIEQILCLNGWIGFLWSFCEIWTYFVAVFWTNWIDFVWTCWTNFLWSFYEIWTDFVAIFWTEFMCEQVE